MKSTKAFYPDGFYIFESTASANSNYIENLKEAKLLLTYFDQQQHSRLLSSRRSMSQLNLIRAMLFSCHSIQFCQSSLPKTPTHALIQLFSYTLQVPFLQCSPYFFEKTSKKVERNPSFVTLIDTTSTYRS